MSEQIEHHYTPHWYDTRLGSQRLRSFCTCGWKGRTWTDSTRTGLAFTRAYNEWVSHVRSVERKP